ncbi:MAG TPA: ion transporter [Flavisolibacter sp.]|jgi:voltage-gated potassium channel|nr:ion transporter [Flavisolibacter sp.]
MKPQIRSERKKLLHTLENILEGPMIFLGFVWLALLVVELVWGLPPLLQTISLAIWGLFIIDFLLKFMLAPDKLAFIKKNILTAISLLIPALRVFRVLRFFRLFRGIRLIRVVSSLNRTMKSLGATMKRRGFGYVVLLSLVVTFGGAAGMYAAEKGNPGFESYSLSLYWTAMRVITAGSEAWPITSEGRTLAFFIAVFGYAIFGYVTATLATFFIGRDAEDKEAPMASAKDVAEIKQMILNLTQSLDELKKNEK